VSNKSLRAIAIRPDIPASKVKMPSTTGKAQLVDLLDRAAVQSFRALP
jgi:hypothetical protein